MPKMNNSCSDVKQSTSQDSKRKGGYDEGARAKKKRRTTSEMIIKLPTADEFSQLRETENLFNSNLLNLQVKQMLASVYPKEYRINVISTWLEELKTFVRQVKYPVNVKISKTGCIGRLVNSFYKHSENFELLSPKSVETIGSFNIESVMTPLIEVDIAVVLPKELFDKHDFLNELYLQKRKFYMYCFIHKLKKHRKVNGYNATAQFAISYCPDKPILIIKSPKNGSKEFEVHLHYYPEENTFKDIRFLPRHNNIRYIYRFDCEPVLKCETNVPTPYYNAVVGQDVVALRNDAYCAQIFNSNSNFKGAFLLLKVWLCQRKLNTGIGAVTNAVMKFYVVYLYKKKIITNTMSSYQIFRNVLINFSNSNWQNDGISLVNEDIEDSFRPKISLFQAHYPVVFMDVTGYVNLAAFVHLQNYVQVVNECKRSLQVLSSPDIDSFEILFLTKVSSIRQFDHIINFRNMKYVNKVVSEHSPSWIKLDMMHNTPSQFFTIIIPALKRALQDRVEEIVTIVNPSVITWNDDEETPEYESVMIGLNINPHKAYSIIEKGPLANLPEAHDFRKFWGDKCELRRFEDGSVCETVVWGKNDWPLAAKRLIIRSIVVYILGSKFDLYFPKYTYVCSQAERLLKNSMAKSLDIKKYGTGEEATMNILKSFNELSRMLYDFDKLSLKIVSVQGASSVFRYSDVFPALPYSYRYTSRVMIRGKNVQRGKKSNRIVPPFVKPIEALIQFTPTGKWPDELEAIRRVKTAVYIEMANRINERFGFTCQPNPEFVDVLKDGYVFRLKICHCGEIASVKRHTSEDGYIEYRNNDRSLHLEKLYIKLPTLTSTLYGLHQQFPAYGPTCCLAKRWLSSHMIDSSHIPDICVDLLVAYLFLYPYPFKPVFQPQTGFLRFLALLANEDSFVKPLILNFNNEMTREKILELENKFNRGNNELEHLTILTHLDESGIMWTKDAPSLVILAHLSKLAKAALERVDSSFPLLSPKLFVRNIKAIFQSTRKHFDIIIHLRLGKIPQSHLSLNVKACGKKPRKLIPIHRRQNQIRWLKAFCKRQEREFIRTSTFDDKIPIVAFDPIKCYLTELRENFGRICTFFYDKYGGDVIGVMLNLKITEPKDIKVSNMSCVMVKDNQLILNIDSLINDFYIIGRSIVKRIELLK